MSKDTVSLPVARSWRDIPQRVKPRAMSSEGRRRLAAKLARSGAAVAAMAAVCWGAWQVFAAVRGDGRDLPAGAQGEPIREVRLETDGVLDQPWLVRTLGLPRVATLMGLDLGQLHDRVLAGGQVSSVAIIRHFPSTLTVRISERTPVARLLAQVGGGEPKPFLVARDGVVYQGQGYDQAMVGSLPWLDGVALARRGAGFAPIEGMETAADLLARAKLDAEPLYRTWRVISLARLQSDGEIEVRAVGGLKIVFGAQEDFDRQLGRLDLVLDAARARPDQPVREVNLSLGPQVPVSFERVAGSSYQ
jgi:POTRA domain, FtsQ-type